MKCTPRSISAEALKESYSFTIGSYTPLTINFKPFSVMPNCTGSTPNYDVTLVNGSPLPNYMTLDPILRTITVFDDGTLKVGA